MAGSGWEEFKYWREVDERERQVLFGNEAFALGALQTVSAAASFGILNQFQNLTGLSGQRPTLVALTTTVVALASAVLGAYFRHLYKMWHVKGIVVEDQEEKNRRFKRSNRYLTVMRWMMTLSAVLIVGSLAVIVVSMWSKEIGPSLHILGSHLGSKTWVSDSPVVFAN